MQKYWWEINDFRSQIFSMIIWLVFPIICVFIYKFPNIFFRNIAEMSIIKYFLWLAVYLLRWFFFRTISVFIYQILPYFFGNILLKYYSFSIAQFLFGDNHLVSEFVFWFKNCQIFFQKSTSQILLTLDLTICAWWDNYFAHNLCFYI